MTEVNSYRFDEEIMDMQHQLAGMQKKKSRWQWSLPKSDKDLNTRIGQCWTVLDDHMGGNRNFVIRIDGKPAGLLSMSVPPQGTPGDEGVKIHGLMSLPGTQGVGRKAIEQAVQMSMQEGRKGRVDLEYLQFSNSRDVYEHFGFVKNGAWDDNHMCLSAPDAQKFLVKSAGKSCSFVSTPEA